MVKTFSYLDPYGYKISVKGYSLEELLEKAYIPKFRRSKPWEKQIALDFIYKFRIPGYYFFGFDLPREVPKWILEEKEPVRKDLIALTRFRADLIVETPSRWLICEIKDYLQSTAISQPLFYEKLFKEYVKPLLPTKAVLIAGFAVKEAVDLAKSFGIQVYITETPTPRRGIVELLKPA